jgi:hypothetical protein
MKVKFSTIRITSVDIHAKVCGDDVIMNTTQLTDLMGAVQNR